MKDVDLRAIPPLSLPYAQLRFAKDEEGNLKVFDDLRKKFVVLTPEEFVRQNFTAWLRQDYGYPASLMANEVEINLNNTRKRCDTIVYGPDCKPLMILEYKAPDVEITQGTFDQIVRYNRELKARYLVVSNGLRHYCCIVDYNNDSYNFIPKIPNFQEAKGLPGVN
ncbi:MAG: type I restriction enzyme HsdR N-terminal domain-containing protein [Muribaculaceae bacterium]|nr:type I restriction enzyme HsdR N-terminal domain-containing protein [Muribaculaceae bacterium]